MNTSALQKPCPRGKNGCPIYDEVARLQQENQELKEKVRTDHLTGMYNVRHLQDALDQEIERTKRTGQPTALVILDLDHFKSVNDSHGHVVGDQALKHVAGIIQESIRRLDIPCRYGGEEFAIILPSTSHRPATLVAERIRENVEKSRLDLGDTVLNFTVSVGLDSYTNQSGENAWEFIERADKLLYEAKMAGRNRVVHSTASSDSRGQVSIEERAALFDVVNNDAGKPIRPSQEKRKKDKPQT